MKIRKILPLAILAVGALVFLSGCDAILDAIFQNNQLSVSVNVYFGDYPFDWNASYFHGYSSGQVTVYVTANSGAGAVTQASTFWTSADSQYVHYNLDFTNLKDDTYWVTTTYTSYYQYPNQTFTVSGQLVTPHDSSGHSATLTFTY